jgi:N-glycosidase YbiA
MIILFYSKSCDYGWLSNFPEHKFCLNGVRWSSMERYYQAQKYAGTELEGQIRKADSPNKARKMCQNRSLTVCQDWDDVKEAIMRETVKAKFEQNRLLCEQFFATGNEELVHESSSNMFRGRSLEGDGDKRLGVIMMDVRRTLKEQPNQA